jgi:predicted SprT family Zn-dependent metalloprotease
VNLTEAQRLAKKLMQTHGLLPQWKFEFDRAVIRFGSCQWGRKKITLSAHLVQLNDQRQVEDTLLHEIAHALAGPRAGHGPKWKLLARTLGCSDQRCYGDEVVGPKRKYVGMCPTCGYKLHRNRRSRVSCGRCDRRFNRAHLIQWAKSDP